MKFVVLPAANDDLRHIDDWVASNFGEATAARVQRNLLAEFHRLARFQELGILRPDVTSRPVRFLSSGPNWIVYQPGKPLVIHRVISAVMDITTLGL